MNSKKQHKNKIKIISSEKIKKMLEKIKNKIIFNKKFTKII